MIVARMHDAEQVKAFVLGGNATFTLRSAKTGTRYTYKVRQPSDSAPHFVKVLTGSENYTFLGTIFKAERYIIGKRSPIEADAPSAKAFAWFWHKLMARRLHEELEVWHEGRCCRCGRALTVPESIVSGIGPECAKMAHSAL